MVTGLQIKDYMTNTGRTQAFVSKKTGIPRSQLNLTLSGKRKLTVPDYEKICKALGVPPSMFFDDTQSSA